MLGRYRLASSLLATLVLTGCANQGTSPEQAEAAVAAALPRQSGLSFRHIRTYPGDVVCGEWQGKSPDGEYRYHLPFIVIQGVADIEPQPAEVSFFCNADPARWWLEETGIGPVDADNAALLAVVADLTLIGEALNRYRSDFYRLPSTDRGLEALLNPGSIPLAGTIPPPYLETLPQDPWGRPYRYRKDSLGGVQEEIDLRTLGADNAKGGSGENADIAFGQLRKIEHLLNL